MQNPEIGKSITAGGVKTNYHDEGNGFPTILIHGSGPGVTAWANWRFNIRWPIRQTRTGKSQ